MIRRTRHDVGPPRPVRPIIRTALLLLAAGSIPAYALNLADFTRCISASGTGAVCQLDAGTYPLIAEINIGRSNITIKGTIRTSRRDTVLQRAPGWHHELIGDVPTATPVTGITIRDLTFDGNRSQNSDIWSSYRPELSINTTRSLLITNCDFIESPNLSVALFGSGSGGVVVNNSYFGHPAIFGLWSDSPIFNPTDSPDGYKRCPTLLIPDNIVVANSTFENGGESVVSLNATGVQIVNNVFQNNKSNTIPFNDTGGQIDLFTCTDSAAVVSNVFKNAPIGPNGLWGDGIELHGTNLTIVDNLVTNNAGNGISMDGTSAVFIANWSQGTGTIQNGMQGIQMYHSTGFRPTDSILIDSAVVAGNAKYAIWINSQFPNADPAFVPINHVVIANSCLEGNGAAPMFLKALGPIFVTQNNVTSGCSPK